MRRKLAVFLTTSVAGLALLGTTGVAGAAPDATQQEIDAILAKNPDGVQTGKDVITWNNGATLTLAADEPCSANSMCLWKDQYFKGYKYEIAAEECGLGYIFNLKDSGFNDQASSWQSTTRGASRAVGTVFYDYDALGGKVWQMLPGRDGPTLPAEYNDQASSVTC